jgi:hypothetical protein
MLVCPRFESIRPTQTPGRQAWDSTGNVLPHRIVSQTMSPLHTQTRTPIDLSSMIVIRSFRPPSTSR